MRPTFINKLIELAKNDDRIMLLTGDLGFAVLEEFKEKFPKRFINVGVAEQNMAGIAAGLAHSGKIPFIYSIGTFLTTRCFEQIRNDICYQNLPVKIVGVGSGFTYSLYGATHQPTDDIALMRGLPNMVVCAPGDPTEVRLATEISARHNGPFYLRIAAKGEPEIHKTEPKLEIGKGIILQNGADATLITTGNMLETGAAVVEKLQARGVEIKLISMPFVKPIDKNLILESAKNTRAIFTLEEHSLIGGLGSAVAEILAEEFCAPTAMQNQKQGSGLKFKRFALPDEFPPVGGSRQFLRDRAGISAEKVSSEIVTLIK